MTCLKLTEFRENIEFRRWYGVRLCMSGALMACAVKLPLGTRGRFHAGLSSSPFSADVVIRRHHSRSAVHAQVGLAAIFSSMDQRSRENLEQFLRRGSD